MITDYNRKAAVEASLKDWNALPDDVRNREQLYIMGWNTGFEAGLEQAAAALEADAKLCDCAAHSKVECACGAWCEWKSVPMARAVEIVRALDGG